MRAVAEEPKGGYFQPDAIEADFAYWAKMTTWNEQEAVSLILGLNPDITSDDTELYYGSASQHATKYVSLLQLARRAIEDRRIAYPNTPARWLAWAKKRDLPMPPALEAEIVRWNGVTGGRDARIVQQQDGAVLRSASKENIRIEARRVYASASKNGSPGPNKPNATKEIRALLKQKGHNASWKLVNQILDEDEFKKLRQPVGKTYRSKFR